MRCLAQKCRVDPRSRGGDMAATRATQSPRGRSPLTRGRLDAVAACLLGFRSIPAHAGETAGQKVCTRMEWVDPRSRGGDLPLSPSPRHEVGRSPLTRGRRAIRSTAWQISGSIPAHAGETEARLRVGVMPWVDPRSRGGDWPSGHKTGAGDGRSPLTRGRLAGQRWRALALGSIPAHAGETVA